MTARPPEPDPATGLGAPRAAAPWTGATAGRTGRAVTRAGLAAALVLISFPDLGRPYGVGIDPSWRVGLAALGGGGHAWGRDVTFTYGPLGFVTYPLNAGVAPTPAGWLLLLGFYLPWWIATTVLAGRIPGGGRLLGFYAALAGFGALATTSVDLASSLPLLVAAGLLIEARLGGRRAWAAAAAVFVAVGLLTKFNVGVAALGCLAAYAGARLLEGPRRPAALEAAALAALVGASLLILFRLSGGPTGSLPGFLRSSLTIAAAYSSQMTADHRRQGLLLAAAAATALAVAAALARWWRRPAARDALLILVPPLLLLFKGTFVRCDLGHVLMGFGPAYGLLGLSLAIDRPPPALRRTVAALAVALLTLTAFAPWEPVQAGPQFPLDGVRHAARLLRWSRHRDALAAAFRSFRAQAALVPSLRGPIGREPVDVYPWELSLVAADDLNWSPRYTLQSYAAFTPDLDAACARHYRGPGAPPWVIYRHEAVDQQHPCLVDPQTWLELLRWYDVAAADGRGTLLLHRRGGPRLGAPVAIAAGVAAWGQRLELPAAGDDLVTMRAVLHLSAAGALREKLYRIHPPRLRIQYRDGTSRTHRAVWRNLAGGALVSDLPRDAGAVARLYRDGSADRVEAITLLGDARWFRPQFEVTFYRLPRPAAVPSTRTPTP
jgi:hypothetical protein